jgi:hypothetical protein
MICTSVYFIIEEMQIFNYLMAVSSDTIRLRCQKHSEGSKSLVGKAGVEPAIPQIQGSPILYYH